MSTSMPGQDVKRFVKKKKNSSKYDFVKVRPLAVNYEDRKLA